LVRFLHEQLDRRLVIVSASAGSGKTSLLIDFGRETMLPVCWYSLEESDRDPQVFLENLIASINGRFPKVGERAQKTLSTSATDHDFDTVISALAAELQGTGSEHFVVIFDDYHRVADSESVNHLFNTLLFLLPGKVHFIIASRTLPTRLDLTRLQIDQQVAALGDDELHFTAEEIRALVKQNFQMELAPDQAADLTERSEGWIAGILLTTPELWPSVFQRQIHGQDAKENVYRFLASETLAHLPEQMQRFLLDSAIFQRLDAAICDQVFEIQNTVQLLRALEERNLFVVRLGDQTGGVLYRYHNLFHEFLRRRLMETDAARWRTLNRRAAEFFESQDSSLGQAISHYLAAEMFDEAARLTERIAQSTFDAGRWSVLAEWIDALPSEVLTAHPDLVVTRGKVFAETGKNREAEDAYTRAIELYEQKGADLSVAKVIVWRAMLWNLSGRYRDAVGECLMVIKVLQRHQAQPDEARAYRILGIAHVHLGAYPQCIRELEQALELYQALDDTTRVAWLNHEIGTCLRIHGDPTADDYYRQALKLWQQTENIPGLAMTLNSIGVGQHIAGDYSRALATLEEARAWSHQHGVRRGEAFALASLGDVYRDLDQPARAMEYYHEAIELGRGMEGFILTYGLVALGETCRMIGDADKVASYLQQAQESAEKHQSNYEIGLVESALGIWACEQKRTSDAILHLNRAQELLKMMRRDYLRARLYLAQAYFARRKFAQAQKELKELARQADGLEPAAIPFIVAERVQLLPLIKYAQSKKIQPHYFNRLYAALVALDRDTSSAPVRLNVQAFGMSRVMLGDRQITIDDWGTYATKELLFLLLANPQGLRKEEIMEALWPGKNVAAASEVFHSTTYRLRRVIPNGMIYEDAMYALQPNLNLSYDVAQFGECLARAATSKGISERIEAYEAAIALYRGDFFAESYGDWCQSIRAQLRRQYLDALQALASIYERHGDYAQALRYYQTLIDIDRDREDIYQAMMRLQFKAGDRAGAARTYQRCVHVLREELNLGAPSQETQAVYAEIAKDPPAAEIAQ
jgi:ATP/maltotriose-dependent transcriptional regulator MalT